MTRILIVDDDEQNRYLLQALLKTNGYTVYSAENGMEALKIARKNPPDLIISDILMPEMDGFALCREWQKDDCLNKIPFVFYTATYTDPKDEKFALSLGAARFIIKPIDPDQFLEIIREAAAEHLEKGLTAVNEPIEEETVFLKEYNERLIQKLEKKMLELEETNKSLQKKIAESRKAKEDLETSEVKFRALFDNAPLSYQSLNEDGSFIDVNPAWLSTLGYGKDEVIGRYYKDFLHEDYQAHFEKNFPAFKKRGYIHDVQFKIRHKKGYYLDIAFEGCVGYNPDGSFKQTYCVFQDITKRKLAEEELKKHRLHLEELVEERTKELKNANKDLEAFAYSVSHDLRAPLRAVHGFTSILLEEYIDSLDDEAKRLGSVIKQNTKKMSSLIDDLLAFSRLGRIDMSFSKIDMKSMANSIYHEAVNAAERKRIKFTVGPIPKAYGDPNMMRQVWMNLISNAVKFSSKRRLAVISISAYEEDDQIVYCVKDNGAGFNMKYKDKLFGVFKRLHSEVNSKAPV